MSHRFCLVAPGDFVATHKITEAVALGGAGGCIPLFVLPTKHRVESMLPYTRWLDYCAIDYVPRLAAVSRKRRRARGRRVPPRPPRRSTCWRGDAARRMRGAKAAKARGGGAAAAPDLSRCMLPRPAAAPGVHR